MANITFEDLPTRTDVGVNDKFIIYRKTETISPESGVNWSTIKSNLLRGLIVKNNFYQKSASFNIKTDRQILDIKNEDGGLISHISLSNKLFCLAQIKCQKQASSSSNVTDQLKNTLCNYELKWIGKGQVAVSLAKGYLPINYYAGATDVIGGSYDVGLPIGRESILIPPFAARSTIGYFELSVWFTSIISTAGVKALVDVNIWTIESDPNN